MEILQRQDQAQAPSAHVIEALADHVGTAPYKLQPPLYDAVDPEALDAILDSDVPVTVQFEYDGHLVVVDADGTVTVE